MTCKDYLEQLQDYLDGDLKEKYARELEVHLENCPNCKNEYQALKQITNLFRTERIQLPSEAQFKQAWKSIELHISAPKSSWYRETIVVLDTMAMRLFSPQSLALRVSFSMGLFVLGIVFGSLYLSPSGDITQRTLKVEHKVVEVPVVQKEEVVKYMEKENLKPQIVEKVVEKPRVIYLASKPIELAPIFPANDSMDLKSETPDLWNPRMNVGNQIEKIQQDLAPSYNQENDTNPSVRTISASQ